MNGRITNKPKPKQQISKHYTINDSNKTENITGKITNQALVINSSNFNLFKVERIKLTR